MSLRVDAHHHLWDLDLTPQRWLDESMEVLRRSFLPDELREAAFGLVDQTVVVQTSSDEAETVWMLAQAAATAPIAGVIGWVDLTDVAVGERLAALQARDEGHLLVGIRHQVHDEDDVDWLRRPEVHAGLDAVGAAGLVYDLLIRPAHLDAAVAAARAAPEVSFVVDHIAKPMIAAGRDELWASGISELAALPNVTCKLSGLVTEADWDAWTVEDLIPFFDVVMESFGADRIMFGSDWPVCLLAASYGDVVDATEGLVARCSDAERAAVLGGTADRIYGLTARRRS